MNTNLELAEINASTLNLFASYHGPLYMTERDSFFFGERVFIKGSTELVEADENGNPLYDVTLESEVVFARYLITVLDKKPKPNAIEESRMVDFKIKDRDSDMKDDSAQLMSEFLIVIAALVLEGLGHKTIFNVKETGHQSSDESNSTNPTTNKTASELLTSIPNFKAG